MHVYFVYQHFDSPDFDVINKHQNELSVPLEGFDLFYAGGRMYF